MLQFSRVAGSNFSKGVQVGKRRIQGGGGQTGHGQIDFACHPLPHPLPFFMKPPFKLVPLSH